MALKVAITWVAKYRRDGEEKISRWATRLCFHTDGARIAFDSTPRSAYDNGQGRG